MMHFIKLEDYERRIVMANFQFYGKIEHTEQTITSLYKAQYHAYEKPQMIVWMIVGFVMVLITAFTDIPVWAKGILLLIGAWMLISMDFPALVRADRVMEARRGNLPKMEYEFHKDAVKISGEGSMSIPYKKIIRLTEDQQYLYFFMDKDSLCMIDRNTVKPKTADELKEFLAKKTGLDWQNEKSLLALNLADIILMVDNKNKTKMKTKNKKK